MERDADKTLAVAYDGDGQAIPTLARLASLQLEPPDGFADRVVQAAGRRSRRRRLALTRADELREWALRGGSTRRRAVASSALLAGAVALGLEARHLRRHREMRAA
jgi:hypothetical protein